MTNRFNELIKNSKGYVENLFTTDCIRTVSGIYVNVFEPKPEMFCIEDIAHALSFMPRFGGHLPIWYSVADHSLMCAKTAKDKDKYEALMHDCSEAYLMDICSPIKAKLRNYKTIEKKLMKVLSEKFGFKYPMSDEVKIIDRKMLETEWNKIMLGSYIDAFKPSVSRTTFLRYYEQLKS